LAKIYLSNKFVTGSTFSKALKFRHKEKNIPGFKTKTLLEKPTFNYPSPWSRNQYFT